MGSKERFFADIMSVSDAVTGSCELVSVRLPDRESPNIRFIVDCGLFQERENDIYNESFPFDPANLDFVLITHNHVDHIGRIPLLVKKGFNKTIYTTRATKRLLSLSMWDCHKVLKENSKKQRKRPLYNSEDVSNSLALVKGCRFEEEIQVHPNVFITFLTNGHLVGSALIYVRIAYPGYEDINLLFTGDYKGKNEFIDVRPIPRSILEKPITVIQESTYGHMETSEMLPCFKEHLLEWVKNHGIVVAPVFSLGRSQEILHELRIMQENGELDRDVPIYLDGKLAIRYTNLFTSDDKNRLGIKEDMRDFLPDNTTFVDKTNRISVLMGNDCKIILTTSGMGSYGPAQAYIAQYISKRDAMIHFTGFTAEGTLGARIKNAPVDSEIEVAGMTTIKRARVEYTTEYSGHAKADEMISFLKRFEKLKLVLVNHGDPETKELFAQRIVDEVGPKDVEILDRSYFYRVSPYGLAKKLSTKF